MFKIHQHYLSYLLVITLFSVLLFISSLSYAQSNELLEIQYAINNLWVLIATVLVILMQAGFALLETGFNASKNAVNVMFKNIIDLSIGILLFFLFGYGIMYGETLRGLLGTDIFLSWHQQETSNDLSTPIYFLFQAAFAATAATIFAGSVAGRLKFWAYIVCSALITAIIYPISGHWSWNEHGWLSQMGFHDFAGSLVVHAVGGFAGLAGALVLRPRLGRFGYKGNLSNQNQTDKALLKILEQKSTKADLLPHNLYLCSLGMFILWIGWYGFNAGSELAIVGESTGNVAKIALNTTLAAVTGAVVTTFITTLLDKDKKTELSITINGTLGGLVGITACCDGVTPVEAIAIGAIAGLFVILGIQLLEQMKIDDTVGAWPVHGLCGMWGGIAYAIFNENANWAAQIVGSIVIPLWAFVIMFVVMSVISKWVRVSPEDEIEGLDQYEHGQKVYYSSTSTIHKPIE